MAVVRDPQFWRRFSMAVHQDEENSTVPDDTSASASTSSSKKSKLKHTDTWLERNARKRKRTRIYGWLIAAGFIVVICAVVFVLLWYTKTPPFKKD